MHVRGLRALAESTRYLTPSQTIGSPPESPGDVALALGVCLDLVRVGVADEYADGGAFLQSTQTGHPEVPATRERRFGCNEYGRLVLGYLISRKGGENPTSHGAG